MRGYSGPRACFPCCGIADEHFDWKENIWVGTEELSWIFLRYTWSCLQSRNKCGCCVLGSESRGHPASAFCLEFWEAGVTSYSLWHCDIELWYWPEPRKYKMVPGSCGLQKEDEESNQPFSYLWEYHARPQSWWRRCTVERNKKVGPTWFLR